MCTVPESNLGVICFENDGTFKFRTSGVAGNNWGGPSLADLDGDGTVEIIDGNRVYCNTGALKWVGTDGAGGAAWYGPARLRGGHRRGRANRRRSSTAAPSTAPTARCSAPTPTSAMAWRAWATSTGTRTAKWSWSGAGR